MTGRGNRAVGRGGDVSGDREALSKAFFSADPEARPRAALALGMLLLLDDGDLEGAVAAFDVAASSNVPGVAEATREALEALTSAARAPLPPEASEVLTEFTRATPAPEN